MEESQIMLEYRLQARVKLTAISSPPAAFTMVLYEIATPGVLSA